MPPIVTGGGLIFIGAALDDALRAFDSETGEELWKGRLPAGGQATPMTYRARPGGRQFVVVAAGGHAQLGTTRGDFVLAFALLSIGAGWRSPTISMSNGLDTTVLLSCA